MRKLRLETEISGEKEVERGFDRLARAVDEVGDEAAQTERQMSRLSRELTEHKTKLSKLNNEYEKTGDTKFIKEFAKERKAGAGLRAMATELRRVEADAKRADAPLAKIAKTVDTSTTSFRGLSTEIKHTEDSITSLSKAFAKSGDKGLLKEIDELSTGLAKLRRVEKTLTGDRKGGISGELRIPGLDLLKSVTSTLGPGLSATTGLGVGLPIAAVAGGLAGTAVLGTAALGGIAGGAALGAQRAEVKSAFAGLGSEVMADLIRETEVFVGPLQRTAGIFAASWRRVKPDIAATFADLADEVEPLAEGLAGGAEKAIRGIAKAAREAEPVTKELGITADRLGGAVGDLFETVTEGAEGSADALRLTTDALVLMTAATGGAIVGLSKVAEGLAEIEERGVVLTGALVLAKLFDETDKSADGAAESTQDLAKGLTDAGNAAGDALQNFRDLNTAFSDAFDNQLSLDQANSDFKNGYNELKESIKENGRSLDETKEKGKANADALRGQIEEAKRLYDEQIKKAGGSVLAIAAADAQLKTNLETIRKWGKDLKLPHAELEAILAVYLAMLRQPNINKEVTVTGNVAGGSRRFANAEGGVFEPAAEGKLRDAEIFSTRSPGRFMIAEPSTGGEAFVPKNGDRARSLKILQHAAGWHDAEVVPRRRAVAMGGGGSIAAPSGGGATLTYVGGTPGGLEALFLSWFEKQFRNGAIRLS